MRNTSRVLAVIVFLAAVGFWVAKGANLGRTINNLAHETVDVSTGLTGVFYEKAFIPGLDFLAVAALIAVVLGGVSFLFGKRKAGT